MLTKKEIEFEKAVDELCGKEIEGLEFPDFINLKAGPVLYSKKDPRRIGLAVEKLRLGAGIRILEEPFPLLSKMFVYSKKTDKLYVLKRDYFAKGENRYELIDKYDVTLSQASLFTSLNKIRRYTTQHSNIYRVDWV